MVYSSQKFSFPMVQSFRKKKKNGGHLIFEPLENRTLKRLVFQCSVEARTVLSGNVILHSKMLFESQVLRCVSASPAKKFTPLNLEKKFQQLKLHPRVV